MKQAKKHLGGVLFLFPQRGLGGDPLIPLWNGIRMFWGPRSAFLRDLVGWPWPRLKQALRACFSELFERLGGVWPSASSPKDTKVRPSRTEARRVAVGQWLERARAYLTIVSI